jgi:hypothetical protein
MMERRAILRGLLAGIPAGAAAVAGAAAKSGAYVRDTKEQSIEACSRRIDALRKRFDESDAATKKLLRTALALSALSLGLDISALL